MPMPGKQARVLCPVCQEPIPPDETECENCGAFVIDEAVVRLSRALGLDRDRALKLFEAGFRHPTQLRDRDPNRVLEKGEVGLLFICTNCGGFVAGADTKCPRCAAEFESEAESPAAEEEDILDLVLCPVCGADNDPELHECEICGEVLRPREETVRPPAQASPAAAPTPPLTPRMQDEPVPGKVREVDEDWEVRAVPASPPAPRPEPPRRPTPAAPPVAPRVVPRETPVVRAPPVTRPPPPVVATKAPLKEPRPPPPEPKPPSVTVPAPRYDPVLTRGPPKPDVVPTERRDRGEPRPTPIPTPRAPRPPRTSRVARASTKRTSQMPRKRVRAPPRSNVNAETVAGFVVAAGAGLLLAGSLGQNLVGAGITGSLIALQVSIAVGLVRRTIRRPTRLDALFLGLGAALGLPAVVMRGNLLIEGSISALASGASFAWLTHRLLRTPQRILLPVAVAIPLIGHGIAAAFDPSHTTALPWLLGIAAALPWPAAVASTDILRRRSATVMRHQVARAERNIARKDYERSLTEYDRAIARTAADIPGAEVPWYGKGATLILLGRYEEAVRAIDKALDINPRNEVAWVNKGNALTRMGQLIDALRCFNAAIKVNPLYEVAWNNKGNTLARLGKLDEALRCYERALGIDSTYRGAWVNMGFVLTKLGRFDEAASCADHALRLQPGRRPEPA